MKKKVSAKTGKFSICLAGEILTKSFATVVDLLDTGFGGLFVGSELGHGDGLLGVLVVLAVQGDGQLHQHDTRLPIGEDVLDLGLAPVCLVKMVVAPFGEGLCLDALPGRLFSAHGLDVCK